MDFRMTSVVRAFSVCSVVMLLTGAAANAPAQRPTRLAAGRVMRPSQTKGNAPLPVAGLWVVLHRVGSDQAAPLDSAKSGSDGRFRISYTPFGAGDALYFVSSRYGGIAYFSPPLRADTVRGGDADVMVYETTPDTTSLRVQGRHFVMSMPRGTRREIAEVFEIDNEGTLTVVARDSTTPIWTVRLPAEAESVTVAPADIGAGAVVFQNNRAELFAPLSPGVRQLVLTYQLPGSAFPIARPLERPVSVLEVLLEEPRAEVEGARLAEVAPASIGGRNFRRFLGSDVPGSAVMRLKAAPPIARNRNSMRVLAVVVALAMLGAFVFWYVSHRGRLLGARGSRPVTEADTLTAALATLDARFERSADRDAGRAQYERERALLKERLARAL